jgi:hypothetical protein
MAAGRERIFFLPLWRLVNPRMPAQCNEREETRPASFASRKMKIWIIRIGEEVKGGKQETRSTQQLKLL